MTTPEKLASLQTNISRDVQRIKLEALDKGQLICEMNSNCCAPAKYMHEDGRGICELDWAELKGIE